MVFIARPKAVLLCSGFVVSSALCLAQAASPHASAPAPLLPANLNNWNVTAPAQTGTDASAVDALNAAALKEYGLKDFASAEYARGSNKIAVKALHFGDATGAYGAFTLCRKPEMHPADIGKEASASPSEICFWTGATAVDATAAHIGAEERDALQALAASLPQVAGPDGLAPKLPSHLPAGDLEKSTVHYAIGPDGYAKGGGVLPAEMIDFSRDAEAVTAKYHLRSGEGTLTILGYPTPQIAGDRNKAIEAMIKGGGLPAGLQGGNSASLGVRRNGSLVAITSGAMSAEDAGALLDKVKEGVAVTWNHPEGYVSEVAKTAKLLSGIVMLTLILGGAAVLLGLFLGGGRAVIRVMRGKPPSTLNDEDFISLKLR